MELIVLGHHGAERSLLEGLLTDAGHCIHTCHDSSWACVGMESDCPLDAHSVDAHSVELAVAVAEPGDRFDAQGIACAHRARIPIVTVGATPDDPVLQYAMANAPDIDGSLLGILERTAGDAGGHRDAIVRALTEHLDPGEVVTVLAERSGRCLSVRLVAGVDGKRAAALADCARGAARRHDPRVTVIDVSVQPPPPHSARVVE